MVIRFYGSFIMASLSCFPEKVVVPTGTNLSQKYHSYCLALRPCMSGNGSIYGGQAECIRVSEAQGIEEDGEGGIVQGQVTSIMGLVRRMPGGPFLLAASGSKSHHKH